MCSFAYSYAYNYGVRPLRETAPDYEPRPGIRDWNDDQIAHVRVVLQRLTAVRVHNPEDVEDLVQETMLTVTMKFPSEELKKGLLVWSMGILRKKIGNYYRKAQRYASLSEQAISVHPAVRHSQTQQSPDAKVQFAELRVLVDQIMSGLPLREKQVLDLLLAGLPASRIAETLSTERYQNIINRLYRGRQKLQRELSKHGYGPRKR